MKLTTALDIISQQI